MLIHFFTTEISSDTFVVAKFKMRQLKFLIRNRNVSKQSNTIQNVSKYDWCAGASKGDANAHGNPRWGQKNKDVRGRTNLNDVYVQNALKVTYTSIFNSTIFPGVITQHPR